MMCKDMMMLGLNFQLLAAAPRSQADELEF